MSKTQKDAFEQRREAVICRHRANDPELRAWRRRRRLSVLVSLGGSLVVISAALLLIKSFLLAVHGPQGYAQMMAPLIEGRPNDALMTRILGADPLSESIAAVLRPVLPTPGTEPVANSAPIGADAHDGHPPAAQSAPQI